MTDNAGWKKKLLMWDWHTVYLEGLQGWELTNGNPLRINLTIKKGTDKPSYNIACEFDDIATDRFYYRDFTDSSLPFVDDGETYRSAFYFSKKVDYDRFNELYSKGFVEHDKTTVGKLETY